MRTLPSTRPLLLDSPREDEHARCTLVFRLVGGRTTLMDLLNELNEHLDLSGTAEIIKVQVGDHLDWPRAR